MVAGVVDMVQAANDAVADVDLDTLTDKELDIELVALVQERHRLDAQIARRATRWESPRRGDRRGPLAP